MTERDKLVEQNLPLVQAIAGKLKRSIGKTLEFEDLVAYGSKGLVEAAERFDASQGVAFSTFAYYRVRGAMIDGLRTMGWYSRSDYARYRAEERATEYLRTQAERESAGDAAKPAGAGETEGQTLDAIAEVLGNLATVHITSLEAAEDLPDDKVGAADADLDRLRMGVHARDAIKKLPDKERQLMELYYFSERNLQEAGAVMGLSKSWACRLHARAVKLLREALETSLGEKIGEG